MAPTTWPLAVDAILATLAAALDVPVFDAADARGYADDLRAGVVIGVESGDDGNCGSFTQEYHDLGAAATRDDSGRIACQVFAQTGDDDLAGVRSRAFAVLADVGDALRADVGLDVGSAIRIELDSGQVSQGRALDVSFCEVLFDLTYTALI